MTGQVEYDFWSSEDRMGTPAERVHSMTRKMVVPLADRMTFIGDGGSVASGITGMAAFGHTPGHMIYTVESGGRTMVITADTANHFVLSLQQPGWEVLFDADKAGRGGVAQESVRHDRHRPAGIRRLSHAVPVGRFRREGRFRLPLHSGVLSTRSLIFRTHRKTAETGSRPV